MPGSEPYEYSLSDRAFLAISACVDDDARQLILAIEMLALDPNRRTAYVSRDYKGRVIPWLEVGALLIGYLVDHRQRRIFIAEVRRIED